MRKNLFLKFTHFAKQSREQKMKKIDGLRIDYITGDAGIALPAEFIGQSSEFKAMALGYWAVSILNERDKIAGSIASKSRRAINSATDAKTIEQIVRSGNVVLFWSDRNSFSHKIFLATFELCTHSKFVTFWESNGYSTFVKLNKASAHGSSIKGYFRISQRAFEMWKEIQISMIASGSGRINQEEIGSRRTPPHLAAELSKAATKKSSEEEEISALAA